MASERLYRLPGQPFASRWPQGGLQLQSRCAWGHHPSRKGSHVLLVASAPAAADRPPSAGKLPQLCPHGLANVFASPSWCGSPGLFRDAQQTGQASWAFILPQKRSVRPPPLGHPDECWGMWRNSTRSRVQLHWLLGTLGGPPGMLSRSGDAQWTCSVPSPPSLLRPPKRFIQLLETSLFDNCCA